MKLSQSKIKERKKQLRRLNGVIKSWRNIQRDYYPEVSYQTLNRFATDKKYIPADVDTCKALDIFADVNPYRQLPKWYKRTPEALEYFNTKRAQIKMMSDKAKSQRDAFTKG
jgi:FMN phosphatase YigB (HAD superfamily)